MSETKEPGKVHRAVFMDAIRDAYSDRGKSVLLLSGNVNDIFRARNGLFLPLQQALYQELCEQMIVLRFDMSAGITFYTEKDEERLLNAIELKNATARSKAEKLDRAAAKKAIADLKFSPLPGLQFLRGTMESIIHLRAGQATLPQKDPASVVPPLCVVFQFADKMFPAGEASHISEIDRMRLVAFLDWISDPLFTRSDCLVVLIAPSSRSVNQEILSLPSTQALEIELPPETERRSFVDYAVAGKPTILGELSPGNFALDSAGLQLTAIESLCVRADRTKVPLIRKDVVGEVNVLLKRQLGDIITVIYPEHGVKDVIGSAEELARLKEVIARCDNPRTAFTSIIVPGPNGSGKTFTLSAVAGDCGRICIELTGLRGMYFGDTDKFFEILRSRLRIYGRILVFVDEAHTAFGSVHSKDTHETEKRLGGNVIKLMSDPQFRGKVVWCLMTSRPDQLDPDIVSRSPIQVPLFDPEGEERRDFLREFFGRGEVMLTDEDLTVLMDKTGHYSKRDYNDFLIELRGSKKPVREVIQYWRASSAIKEKRRFQSLIATQFCTYPDLLPKEYRGEGAEEKIQAEIESLRFKFAQE